MRIFSVLLYFIPALFASEDKVGFISSFSGNKLIIFDELGNSYPPAIGFEILHNYQIKAGLNSTANISLYHSDDIFVVNENTVNNAFSVVKQKEQRSKLTAIAIEEYERTKNLFHKLNAEGKIKCITKGIHPLAKAGVRSYSYYLEKTKHGFIEHINNKKWVYIYEGSN